MTEAHPTPSSLTNKVESVTMMAQILHVVPGRRNITEEAETLRTGVDTALNRKHQAGMVPLEHVVLAAGLSLGHETTIYM